MYESETITIKKKKKKELTNMFNEGRIFEHFAVNESEVVFTEIIPVEIPIYYKGKCILTSKWIDFVIWQEISDLVHQITSRYLEDKPNKSIRVKKGSNVIMGYKFRKCNPAQIYMYSRPGYDNTNRPTRGDNPFMKFRKSNVSLVVSLYPTKLNCNNISIDESFYGVASIEKILSDVVNKNEYLRELNKAITKRRSVCDLKNLQTNFSPLLKKKRKSLTADDLENGTLPSLPLKNQKKHKKAEIEMNCFSPFINRTVNKICNSRDEKEVNSFSAKDEKIDFDTLNFSSEQELDSLHSVDKDVVFTRKNRRRNIFQEREKNMVSSCEPSINIGERESYSLTNKKHVIESPILLDDDSEMEKTQPVNEIVKYSTTNSANVLFAKDSLGEMGDTAIDNSSLDAYNSLLDFSNEHIPLSSIKVNNSNRKASSSFKRNMNSSYVRRLSLLSDDSQLPNLMNDDFLNGKNDILRSPLSPTMQSSLKDFQTTSRKNNDSLPEPRSSFSPEPRSSSPSYNFGNFYDSQDELPDLSQKSHKPVKKYSTLKRKRSEAKKLLKRKSQSLNKSKKNSTSKNGASESKPSLFSKNKYSKKISETINKTKKSNRESVLSLSASFENNKSNCIGTDFKTNVSKKKQRNKSSPRPITEGKEDTRKKSRNSNNKNKLKNYLSTTAESQDLKLTYKNKTTRCNTPLANGKFVTIKTKPIKVEAHKKIYDSGASVLQRENTATDSQRSIKLDFESDSDDNQVTFKGNNDEPFIKELYNKLRGLSLSEFGTYFEEHLSYFQDVIQGNTSNERDKKCLQGQHMPRDMTSESFVSILDEDLCYQLCTLFEARVGKLMESSNRNIHGPLYNFTVILPELLKRIVSSLLIVNNRGLTSDEACEELLYRVNLYSARNNP